MALNLIKPRHFLQTSIIVLLLINVINVTLFVVADNGSEKYEDTNTIIIGNNIEYNNNINTVCLENNDLNTIEITQDLEFEINTISRDGHSYDRIIIKNGGIDRGDHGEERPFYQTTLKLRGEITDLTLNMLVPYLAPSTPTPFVLPPRLGFYVQELDPMWVGVPKLDIEADWTLTHLSSTTVDGAPGELYSLKVYPIEYTTDGYARIFTQIEVTYTYTQYPIWSTTSAPDPGYKPTGAIKYLIITHSDYENAVQPLATWKSQKGFFTQVITTDEIDEKYDDGDLQLKMRKYIGEMEAKYDLEYLLLVGDWAKVPTRNTKNSYAQPMMGEPDTFASDLYFACVDPNTDWNKNGDMAYAEEGELDDAVPDMGNGRLAVNTVSDLTGVINSLIAREQDLPWSANTTKAVYMVGDPGYIPGNPMNLMKHYWTEYGQSIYTGKDTIFYDESGTLNFTSDSYIQVMDDGYQAMSYFGHGQPTQLPDLFNTGQMGQLAATGPDGILFTMACLTNWYDDPSTGQGMMGAVENCLGEVLTETPGKGLVGSIGASRMSVGDIDLAYSADAPGLQEDYWRALKEAAVGNITPTVGSVWKEMVTHFSASFYPFTAQGWDNPGLRTFLEYNLLGEPDAPLILRKPEELKIEYKVSPDQTSVWAKVTNATGVPVENARVTIYRQNELGRTDVTSNNGELTLIIPPNNGGVINITASRPGDNPATTSFSLPDTLEPQPLYSVDPEEPNGDNGYYISNPVVTLFGNEPVKVEYKWDEGEVTFFETETSVTAPEGNHTLNFRVVDLFGHWSDWSDILISVDMTPPDLIIRTDPEIPDGNDGWFITDPTIILESSELLNDTFYSIDGGDAEEYLLPFQVEEGAHFVTFTVTDLAGNDNDAGLTLMIDLTAPSSVIEISDDPDGFNDYYITIPELELSCPDEPEAGIEFKWDDGEWVEYEVPIYPEDGIHTLYYRGRDLSGNYESAHDQTFKVDTAPPITELNVDPVEPDGSNGFYISTPIINISKNEGEAYYILGGVNDDIDWTTSTKLVNGFVIPEGEWVLFVKTIDLAGNEANIGPTQFYVDLTPPKFNFEVGPSTPNGDLGWYTEVPTIKLTSESPDTTMYLFDADADEWVVVDQEITIDDGGEHQLRFKAVDIAGNVVYDETEWLKIDQVAPELTILTPQENEVVNESVIIEWAGDDEISGMVQYKIKLDNGIWSDMEDSTSLELTVLQDGMHEIHLKAFDEAGNTVTITRTFEFQSMEVDDDRNDQDKDDRVDPKSDSDSGDGNDGLAPGIIAGILVLVLIIIIVVSIGLYVHMRNKHEELELMAEMDELDSMGAPNPVPVVRQTYNAYLLPMAQPLLTKNYMFPGPREQVGSNTNSNFIKSPPHQNQNKGTEGGELSLPPSVPPQTQTRGLKISTPPTPRVIWRPAPVPRPKVIKPQDPQITNFTTDPPRPSIKVKVDNNNQVLTDKHITNKKI